MAKRIRLKRVYDPPAPEDGRRILVDRLWPRGLSKAEAHVDVWLKDVAPSDELRRWFGHRPDRWDEFRRRYAEELRTSPALDELGRITASGPATLLYAAKDPLRNNAAALAELLSG